MRKSIPCLEAIIWINEDGTMDCPWLTLYFGDMTEEEYKAAGTALSVRRGCGYCYKHLEWKHRCEDEGWTYKKSIAHGAHQDWPGEWASINEVLNSSGELVGYEAQWELFRTLHDAEEAGWKLHFEYFKKFEELYRKEEEKLNKFYTKCGREFNKSTEASVTGYTIKESDKECANCPFQVEVTDGYGATLKHIRWECRAGSKKPNQKDEWSGDLEGKNSIHVKSLHNNFLESVLIYCEGQPDLTAGYNQDLEDCRRTISVHCSSNKKGIAAKKALVEKFFPVNEKVIYELELETEDGCCCENCEHGIDYGESVEYIKCGEGKREKDVKKKQAACINYVPSERASLDDYNSEDLEEQMHELLRDEKKEDGQVYQLDDEKKCISSNEQCGHYCKHNEGCSLLLVSQKVLKDVMEGVKGSDENCEVYKQALKKVNKTTENAIKIPENVTETANIVTFDYSSVDGETAEFLQEKANRITEIRIKSVIALGKELKEAQEKLSNNKTGTFGVWSQSIGFSRQTVQNYIQAYDYIVKNFDNIESAENIQPSLLFAVSKPSAPAELQKAVLDGDITTHKQYKDLENQLNELKMSNKINFDMRMKSQTNEIESNNRWLKENQAREKAEQERDNIYKAYQKDLKDLNEQLEQAKNSGLQEDILNYQQQIGSLNIELAEKNKLLKDKPIEVPKVIEKIVEVASSVDKNSVQLKVYGSLLNARHISTEEIKICAEADFVRKMSIIEYLEELQKAIPGYLKILNEEYLSPAKTEKAPQGKCADCQYVTYDGLKEVDEDAGKVYCTNNRNKRLVLNCGCSQFVEF